MFMPGDEVNYVGEQRKELRGKLGIVLARVKGVPNEFVVDFETGDSYVIFEANLVRHKRAAGKEAPQFHSFRKRRNTEEE